MCIRDRYSEFHGTATELFYGHKKDEHHGTIKEYFYGNKFGHTFSSVEDFHEGHKLEVFAGSQEEFSFIHSFGLFLGIKEEITLALCLEMALSATLKLGWAPEFERKGLKLVNCDTVLENKMCDIAADTIGINMSNLRLIG